VPVIGGLVKPQSHLQPKNFPKPLPLYHPGDHVRVRLSVNWRRGEGVRTVRDVLVADTRGWFYRLDAPIDVDGVLIDKVYEDEIQEHL
jgi:hypothetical protein